MFRLTIFLVLAVGLAGCGNDVAEYSISVTEIERFEASAEQLAARDDYNSPLAMSVLPSNQIGSPPGVQIWNPEATLKSVGIENGDIIALIDDQVPSQEYGHSFAAGQKPFGSATEQYVHFVSGLLRRHETQESVLLNVHQRYATNAEREKHGSILAKEPELIRIVFE